MSSRNLSKFTVASVGGVFAGANVRMQGSISMIWYGTLPNIGVDFLPGCFPVVFLFAILRTTKTRSPVRSVFCCRFSQY